MKTIKIKSTRTKISESPVPLYFKSKNIYGEIKREVYFRNGTGHFIYFNKKEYPVSFNYLFPKEMQHAIVLEK